MNVYNFSVKLNRTLSNIRFPFPRFFPFLSFSDRKRCLYKRPCFFLYIFPRTSPFFSVCFFSPLFTLEVIHRARNSLGHIPREGERFQPPKPPFNIRQ